MPEYSQQNVSIIDSTVGKITQKIIQYFCVSPNDQQALRNRTMMLKLVKNIWVAGLLEHSLHGAALLELGIKENREAVEHPWDMTLQMSEQPNRQLPSGTSIVDVFAEMNQRLLILGEPGAGKTTMLLDLARTLISQAEDDPTHPIPVVFNLSSWTEKRPILSDWLIDELDTKYSVPKRIARSWIEGDQLLLLLDGLDEVESGSGDACLEAINSFLQEHFVPLAVCSRTKDYDNLNSKLRLHNAVCIQPLTSQQIHKYLGGLGQEFEAVRITLEEDTIMQELAQSPMMLSIMTIAYRGTLVEEIQLIDSLEYRRKHIFNTYLQNMFKRRGINKHYSMQQTSQWLSLLAQKMKEHTQTIYLIERMQSTWLPTSIRRLYKSTVGLGVGLGAGLFAGLVAALFVGLGSGLVAALSTGLSAGLRAGLYEIKCFNTVRWSWRASKRGLLVGLVVGFFTSVSGFAILMIGLGSEPGNALVAALGGGLGGALFAMLDAGLVGEFVDNTELRIAPNQGIRQSARNSIIFGLGAGLSVWLFVGLLVGLSVGLGAGLNAGLASGLVFGLILGLMKGGIAVIQHHALRFFLSRKNQFPWDIVTFLDYATKLIFLRKVGCGYIFIHRLVLEYFAELGHNV